MEEVLYDEKKYTLLKNHREGYDIEELKKKFTDYFLIYDYIVGDWAYGKLRLKGFYKEDHKNCKEINNFKNLESYLINNCAHDCRYFLLVNF